MNHLFLVFLLLFAGTVRAQTLQDSLDLRRDMDAYNRVTLKLDYDSLLYFMPPAMFDIAPKESVKEQLESAFENGVISISFGRFEYRQPSSVGKVADHLYAIVPYDADMTMTFADTSDRKMTGMILMTMKLQFGSENVEMKPDISLFIATPNKRMIAIKSPGFDSWKFIEDKRTSGLPGDDQVQELVDMVIPKEVLEATKG